tara:strand:+ start:380 stop:496 length:117 start_codon:yes stop_codon:yes gene_type:complete
LYGGLIEAAVTTAEAAVGTHLLFIESAQLAQSARRQRD